MIYVVIGVMAAVIVVLAALLFVLTKSKQPAEVLPFVAPPPQRMTDEDTGEPGPWLMAEHDAPAFMAGVEAGKDFVLGRKPERIHHCPACSNVMTAFRTYADGRRECIDCAHGVCK